LQYNGDVRLLLEFLRCCAVFLLNAAISLLINLTETGALKTIRQHHWAASLAVAAYIIS